MTVKKILHFADAHIGYAGNSSNHNEFSSLRINREIDGVNVRTIDINKAFEQIIDLAIEQQVDYVVDAGDLFDQWGYKANSIYNFVQKQILRLLEHNIQYVGIIGNHDLPKLRNKGTYSQTLNDLPHVNIAYKGIYEKISFEEDNIYFHAVPSTFRQEMLDESINSVEKVEGAVNIGIGHFGVTTIKHYAEAAINSLVLDLDSLINCEMDYFALGDYHKFTDFGHGIYYPGSIENLGFGELGNKPQVLLLEIDTETHEKTVTPHYLKTRPMIQLPTLDVDGMSIDEVNAAISKALKKQDLTDKIVRFRVRHLPKTFKRLIDDLTIATLTEDALFFKIEFIDMVDKIAEASISHNSFVGVIESWGDFVDSIESDGSFDKEELKALGYAKLTEVIDDASL